LVRAASALKVAAYEGEGLLVGVALATAEVVGKDG
jgi:hypothetical protein